MTDRVLELQDRVSRRNGGPRGDLLVDIRVRPSNEFERHGMDIYTTTSISFAQAALGGDIRVKTIDGDVKFNINREHRQNKNQIKRQRCMPRT